MTYCCTKCGERVAKTACEKGGAGLGHWRCSCGNRAVKVKK